MEVPKNHIKQTKRHLCASGSILLPLAQKWRLVGVMLCRASIALALPSITAPVAFAADAVTLSVPNSPLSVTASATGEESAEATITVDGTGSWGYTLSIKSANGNNTLKSGSNDLNSISDERDNVGAFENNSWGYKIIGGGIAETKFHPGPTGESATKLDETNSPIAATNYSVTLGAKIDGNQPAGTYSGQMIIMVTAKTVHYSLTYNSNGDNVQSIPDNIQNAETPDKEVTLTLSSISLTWEGYIFKGWCDEQPTNSTAACTGDTYLTGSSIKLALQATTSANTKQLWAVWEKAVLDLGSMQDFVCSMLPAIGDTGLVTDTRNGNQYRVRRLKANAEVTETKCWMLDNLRLGDEKMPEDRKLKPDDSDVSEEWALPESEQDFAESTYDSPPQINTEYVDVEVDGAGGTKQKVGVYYNWHAATADTGTHEWQGQTAEGSVCPKGWKLPKTQNQDTQYGDFAKLKIAYNLESSAETSRFMRENTKCSEFLLSGMYNIKFGADSVYNLGSGGYYWSRASHQSQGCSMSISDSSFTPVQIVINFPGFLYAV